MGRVSNQLHQKRWRDIGFACMRCTHHLLFRLGQHLTVILEDWDGCLHLSWREIPQSEDNPVLMVPNAMHDIISGNICLAHAVVYPAGELLVGDYACMGTAWGQLVPAQWRPCRP